MIRFAILTLVWEKKTITFRIRGRKNHPDVCRRRAILVGFALQRILKSRAELNLKSSPGEQTELYFPFGYQVQSGLDRDI